MLRGREYFPQAAAVVGESRCADGILDHVIAYVLPFSLIFTIPWGLLTAILQSTDGSPRTTN